MKRVGCARHLSRRRAAPHVSPDALEHGAPSGGRHRARERRRRLGQAVAQP
jgi:hypothetical protein